MVASFQYITGGGISECGHAHRPEQYRLGQHGAFTGSSCELGGGICNAGTLTVQNSTISGNTCMRSLAAASTTGARSPSENSTIADNEADRGRRRHHQRGHAHRREQHRLGQSW